MNGAILTPSLSIQKQTVDLVPGRLLEEPTHHVRPGCTTGASGHRVLAPAAPETCFPDIDTWAPGAHPTSGTAVLAAREPSPEPPQLRGGTAGGSGPHARSCGAASIWPSSGLAWAAPGLSRPRGATSPCISANALAPRIFINFICFPDIKYLFVFFLAPFL